MSVTLTPGFRLACWRALSMKSLGSTPSARFFRAQDLFSTAAAVLENRLRDI
jgi:hypothetical protein